jgi:hypothetical protein
LKINPTLHVATSVKDPPATLADAIAAAEAFGNAEAEEELSEGDLQILDAEFATIMPSSARLALLLALRTAQRRLSVVSALKASFRSHPTFGKPHRPAFGHHCRQRQRLRIHRAVRQGRQRGSEQLCAIVGPLGTVRPAQRKLQQIWLARKVCWILRTCYALISAGSE